MSWLKQTAEQPLYPDLLWGRPERRDQAGKLTIIGGNLHSFAAPAEAFQAASKAGVGVSRIVLPSALKRTLRDILPDAIYAPSTPSGSFAQASLGDWLEQASWADGTLLAGDFGHNSETALVLESFLQKHSGPVAVTQDATEYFLSQPNVLVSRPQTAVIISMGQLQKLAKGTQSLDPIRQSTGLPDLATWLAAFTESYPLIIITKHLDQFIVAYQGEVSTTPTDASTDMWRVATAAKSAVWWIQNPTKPFKAITAALLD